MQTLDDPVERPEIQEQIRTFLARDDQGTSYLYATALLKEGEWMLVARQEQSDAFNALHSAAYLILFISGIGGVVVVMIAQFMTGRIVRHMERTDAEKDRLRYQLIGAARLVELGEMAAGFAHEVNNPLQIIRNEQSLMEMNLAELPLPGTGNEAGPLAEIRDSLAQIRLQIDRCAEITQAILKFGRQQKPRIREVDLGGVISETAAMVANKIHIHGIDYTEKIDPATPRVSSDPAQLQQVFVNLFNNAIDAVIERHGSSGGELRVEVCVGENGTADVRVEDNGTGIAPENMRKIFSPFFTTKPVGKGSGLGLSVCYGIVDKLGGTMAVESRQGEGTVFVLRFPGGGSPDNGEKRAPSAQRVVSAENIEKR
jgi:two-component system NtrC family sensor kinase